MRRPAAGGEARERASFFRPLLQEKNSLTVSSLFPYNENRIPVEGWLYAEHRNGNECILSVIDPAGRAGFSGKGVRMHHLIGKEAEEFKVQAFCRGKFEQVTKESLLGHWSVLFFYPADFTFVCPTELGDLQDYYEDFQEEGCEIYSVSEDTHFVHKAWADASETIRKIQYPMLGDPAGVLARQFGVLEEEAGQALRATFILNPEGKIRAYEIHDMGIGRNAQELLRKVQAAKYVEEHGDQVCPAKWKPGEETLMPSLDLVGLL